MAKKQVQKPVSKNSGLTPEMKSNIIKASLQRKKIPCLFTTEDFKIFTLTLCPLRDSGGLPQSSTFIPVKVWICSVFNVPILILA